MKSMTGYGSIQASIKGVRVEVSVRSVNGRFLEIRYHSPREYYTLESDVKKIVNQFFKRGTVDIYLNRVCTEAYKPKFQPMTELGVEWLKTYKNLAKKLKLSDPPTMEMLIRQVDIIKVQETHQISSSEEKLVFETLKKTLQACQKERVREGRSLKTQLLEWLKSLSEIVKKVESKKEEVNKLLEEKYLTRIKKLGLSGEVDSQRVAQEIIFQIDKTDVSEELSRLKEHIKMFEKIIQGSESEGKKLDFYTQELLREMNTIGSKANVAEVTQWVVDGKTLIEKIREQVQNIE